MRRLKMEGVATEVRPEIKVEKLEGLDPEFSGGSTHTARALLTNTTTKDFDYTLELYLGVTKAATSGQGVVTIPAGQSLYADFILTMPLDEATHHVYLDVIVAGELIKHYQATEDVTIVIAPDIEIGPITWV
jgi:hypothetical protein